MWVPATAAELENAVRTGVLEETHTFDVKAQLPTSKRNRDLAEDVAAMTVDGGVLVYGVAEDDRGKATVLSPIPLRGARERIAQIVETSISEPPYIEVQELESPDRPGHGYLIVVVPQSGRAPHQVIGASDLRYYGRGATGNRILAEGEVALLYARRAGWEFDRDSYLATVVDRHPRTDEHERLIFLWAFIRPLASTDTILDPLGGDPGQVRSCLLRGAQVGAGEARYAPDIRQAGHCWRRGADGWTLSTDTDVRDDDTHEALFRAQYLAEIELDADGTARFVCGRVGDWQHNRRWLFPESLAGNLASFLGAIGEAYRTVGYVGAVDVGAAVGGLHGASSYRVRRAFGAPRYDGADVFKKTTRTTAGRIREHPREIVLELVGRVMAVMNPPGFDPFGCSAE